MDSLQKNADTQDMPQSQNMYLQKYWIKVNDTKWQHKTVWSEFCPMKQLCTLWYSNCAQWWFCLDGTIAQTELNLRWAHMSEIHFLKFLLRSVFDGAMFCAVIAYQSPLFSTLAGLCSVIVAFFGHLHILCKQDLALLLTDHRSSVLLFLLF